MFEIDPREHRKTEKRILERVGEDGRLTSAEAETLVKKMETKKQTYENARAIASETELESERAVDSLSDASKKNAKQAIKNYVASSTAINDNARGEGRPFSPGVTNLDKALTDIRKALKNLNISRRRIVYRSVFSYDSMADIQYGPGKLIGVNDFIGDKGFVSTSEHRQFVLGREQKNKVEVHLKIIIVGKTGVPIAIESNVAYTNSNQRKMFDIDMTRKNIMKKAWRNAFKKKFIKAGQAEVLFPRNTVFQVKRIKVNTKSVSVVLEERKGGYNMNRVKSMYDGSPLY